MELQEGSVLYARMDFKIAGMQETEQDAMDTMAYAQGIAKERYLVAGLLGDMAQECIDGAMMLYEAKDMEEAHYIAQNDPIIARGFYRYELYRWNVLLVAGGE